MASPSQSRYGAAQASVKHHCRIPGAADDSQVHVEVVQMPICGSRCDDDVEAAVALCMVETQNFRYAFG